MNTHSRIFITGPCLQLHGYYSRDCDYAFILQFPKPWSGDKELSTQKAKDHGRQILLLTKVSNMIHVRIPSTILTHHELVPHPMSQISCSIRVGVSASKFSSYLPQTQHFGLRNAFPYYFLPSFKSARELGPGPIQL